MHRTLLATSVALAFSALPLPASAAPAYVASGTEIHAGPGDDYPVVAQLGSGITVDVNGCLSDYQWCDVSLGSNRGWVYAAQLEAPYQNGRVSILEYGPRLAIFPTVTFSLSTYWDRYYRDRPFYAERERWEQRSHDYANAHPQEEHAQGRNDQGNQARTDNRAGAPDGDRARIEGQAQNRGEHSQNSNEQARTNNENQTRSNDNQVRANESQTRSNENQMRANENQTRSNENQARTSNENQARGRVEEQARPSGEARAAERQQGERQGDGRDGDQRGDEQSR